MSSDVILQVKNIGKFYFVNLSPIKYLLNFFFQNSNAEKFWAVKNVSFILRRGEALGIIGRNGAGKSTLLQLISSTIAASEGEIKHSSRVAAILELGSSFNPQFTGIENIYLNAKILGIDNKTINSKLDQILSFSELGEYVHKPLKTYSSGMVVRLAFAVLANIDADILIIDEALAVGDILFQQKCIRFLEKFKQNGGSILFVSHDTNIVTSFCDTAVYLKRTNCTYSAEVGDANRICKLYLADLYGDSSAKETVKITRDPSISKISSKYLRTDTNKKNNTSRISVGAWNVNSDRFGLFPNIIEFATFIDKDGNPISYFVSGNVARLLVGINLIKDIEDFSTTLMLKDRNGRILFSDCSLLILSSAITLNENNKHILFEFIFPNLVTGDFAVDIAIASGSMYDHQVISWVHDGLIVSSINDVNVVGGAGFSDMRIKLL